MTQAVFFYVFSTLLLGAAALVVCSRQPIYSVLSLLLAMCCLAALFVMLGAYFVAALQLLLYAGAVLVLFLFVIMLLNLGPDAQARWAPLAWRGAGGAVAALLFMQLALAVIRARIAGGGGFASEAAGVEALGRQLFTTYLLPFELTSFLILAAVIGAVALARGLWKRSP